MIGLLFLLLPFVASLAFVETPVVSDIVLRFALRLARFRSGLRLETSSWDVRPFSFSASLNDVELGIEKLEIRAPSVSVQLSPVSLLIGRIRLREVKLESPMVYGQSPPRWFAKSDSPDKTSDASKKDFPTWLGRQILSVTDDLKARSILLDRIRMTGLRVQTRDVRLLRGDFELSNLDGGEIRVETLFEGLSFPGNLSAMDRLEVSVGLFRERKDRFFLTSRKIHVGLGAPPEGQTAFTIAEVLAEGRWPGEFRTTVKADLTQLAKWARASKWVVNSFPAEDMSGRLDVSIASNLGKDALESLHGKIEGKELKFDGYFPNDVSAAFKWTPEGTEIGPLNIGLPVAVGGKLDGRGTVSSDRIVVQGNNLSGQLQLKEAHLCSILVAASVTDCHVDVKVSGPIPFSGTLDPFLLHAKPALDGTRLGVASDPMTTKNYLDKLATFHPLKLTSDVFVEAKKVRIEGADLTWPDGSVLTARGPIVYKPTVVDLTATARGASLQAMLEEFLGLEPLGKAVVDAQIYYNIETPKEKGRTRIAGHVAIDKFGLAGQTFGLLSGPVEYSRNELRLGPLKLLNGGGKAVVTGRLHRDESGAARLKLAGAFDRLEVDTKLPDSTKPFFHGFVSGLAEIEGLTDFERDPEKFFKGPISLQIDTMSVFGIPFSSAKARAVYSKKALHVTQFQAKKGSGLVDMWGVLHPTGGTELRFKSDDISLRNFGWDPGIEAFQDGQIRIQEGFWSPTKGWKARMDLDRLRIAGRSLNPGSLELHGEGSRMEIVAQLQNQADVSAVSESVNGKPSTWTRFKAHLRDEAFYGIFAWLKRWDVEHPLTVKGDLDVEGSTEGGKLLSSGLEVFAARNAKKDSTETLLLKMGAGELQWNPKGVRGSWMGESATSKVAINADTNGRDLRVKGEVPAVLLDLFIPLLKVADGRIGFDGKVPMPPDVETLDLAIRVDDASLLVPGVGQPVTRLRGDMNLRNARLNFNSLVGQSGSGNVQTSGVYRLDNGGLYLDLKLNRAQTVILDDIIVEANGDLSLKGEKSPYMLAGNLLVSNALYTKEFSEKPGASATGGTGEGDAPEAALRFGLNVELGPNCRVRNTSAAALVSGRFSLAGTSEKPDFQGTIDVLNGSVYAKDTEFRVSQGKVTFPGGGTNVPNVNLLASTSVKQPSEDYRIQLQVRGPADHPSLDLSSDPPLPPGDIVNLLAFGVKSPGSDLEAARAEALQVLFGSMFGSNIHKATGFQVRFEAGSNLAQEKAIPKVTAVRKISDKVTATVGRSLDLNPETNVQLDYKLLRNVNLTGVWEKRDTSDQDENTSTGVDLRFRFDLK